MVKQQLHNELDELLQITRGILNLYGIIGIDELLRFIFIPNRLDTEERSYLSSRLLSSTLLKSATQETNNKELVYVSPLVKNKDYAMSSIKKNKIMYHKPFAPDEIMLAGTLPCVIFKNIYYKNIVLAIETVCSVENDVAIQMVQDIWIMLQNDVKIEDVVSLFFHKYKEEKMIIHSLQDFAKYAPRWKYKGYSLFEIQDFCCIDRVSLEIN